MPPSAPPEPRSSETPPVPRPGPGDVPLLDPLRQWAGASRRRAALAALAILALAAAGVVVATRRTPGEKAADLCEAARVALRERRAEDAAALLRRAAEVAPADPEARFLLGVLALAGDRPAEAERRFREALSIRPGHVGAASALARMLARSGTPDDAMALLEGLAGTAPGDGAAVAARAEARLLAGDLGGALEDLGRLVGTGCAEDTAETCLLAGHLAEFLGRTTWSDGLLRAADGFYAAAPHRRRAGRDVPPQAAAEAWVACGQPRIALRALAGAPPGVGAIVLEAEALRIAGAPADAERSLRTAIAADDAPAVRAALVRLLAAEGRARGARLELAEARRVHPADAAVEHAALLVAEEEAAASAPSDLISAVVRPRTRTFNAIEPLLADRALRSPWGPATVRAGLALRGPAAARAAADPGRAEEARTFERDLETLLRDAPDDPVGRIWRGALRLSRGDVAGALDDLSPVRFSGGDQVPAALLRALALGANGEWRRAASVAAAVSQRAEAGPAGAAVEAWARLGAGDRSRAADTARRAAARWPGDLHVVWVLREALAAPSDASPAAAATAREREWLGTRLRLASLEPDAARSALRAVADASSPDELPAAALSGLWGDLAAVWGERESRDPADARAPAARATCLLRSGRPREADDVLRRAAERTGSAALVRMRSRLLRDLGDYDGSEALLAALATDRPGDAALRFERALVKLARGDSEGGLAALRGVVADASAPAPVRADAALALLSGDDASAPDADLVAQAAAALPPDASGAAAAVLADGYARFVRGDLAGAAAAAEAAMRAEPGRSRGAVLAARVRIRAADLEGADGVLVAALAAHPSDPTLRALATHVRLVLGLRALDRGEWAAAAEAWERALTGSRLDFMAAAVLADVLIRRRDALPVAEILDRAAAGGPGSGAPQLLLRGRVLAARGATPASHDVFAEALAQAPLEPAAVAAFVESAVATDAADDAERACRHAISAAGDRTGLVHGLLARVLERRGDGAGAEAAWREAVLRGPEDFAALASLTAILTKSGRGAEARTLVAAADPARVHPVGTEERLAALRARVEAGPTSGAVERLRSVLYGGAEPPEAIHDLGRARAMTGDLAGALACFERAAEMEPDGLAARASLVACLAAMGRLDEAAERLRDRTRAHPTDAGAWCLLGMIAEERGDPAAAEGLYLRALAVRPDDALAANNLACVVFGQAGRQAEAVARIDAAARARPDVPHLITTHAWLLLRSGDAPGALAVLDDAVRAHPGFGLARLHRAEAFLAAGRREAAVGEYRLALRLDASVARRASSALRDALPPE